MERRSREGNGAILYADTTIMDIHKIILAPDDNLYTKNKIAFPM